MVKIFILLSMLVIVSLMKNEKTEFYCPYIECIEDDSNLMKNGTATLCWNNHTADSYEEYGTFIDTLAYIKKCKEPLKCDPEISEPDIFPDNYYQSYYKKNNDRFGETYEGMYGCLKPIKFGKFLPMEDCEKDEECSSGKCQGVCIGKSTGDSCDLDDECDIGLYCHIGDDAKNGTCQFQKKEGARCNTPFECQNNCGCLNNTCTKYHTLKIGDFSTDPVLCESNYTFHFNDDEDGVKRCAFKEYNGRQSREEGTDGTYRCTESEEEPGNFYCPFKIYKVEGEEITQAYDEVCKCDYSSQKPRCQIDHKNDYYKEALEIYKKYIREDNLKLHTKKRFSLSLMEKEELEKVVKIKKFPLLSATISCILDFYTYELGLKMISINYGLLLIIALFYLV